MEQSLHATAPPHAPDDPDNRHTTHNGRLSRTIGHRAANTRRTDGGGGRIPHAPEQHRHLTRQRSLDVAGALPSPTVSPFQRRRAATRRAEPVSAGDLGAARDAGMRDGSVGSVPKADRLGCELRQPPFLYLDHVQAVGGHAGWPRASGVRASVDEGMSSREPSSSAAGAPVQLSEFEIAIAR